MFSEQKLRLIWRKKVYQILHKGIMLPLTRLKTVIYLKQKICPPYIFLLFEISSKWHLIRDNKLIHVSIISNKFTSVFFTKVESHVFERFLKRDPKTISAASFCAYLIKQKYSGISSEAATRGVLCKKNPVSFFCRS